jgi:hypothetical protein
MTELAFRHPTTNLSERVAMSNQIIPSVIEEQERWLPAVGWETFYSVSSLGRVRRDAGGDRNTLQGRILKIQTSKAGYSVVSLCRHGTAVQVYVHHLVLRAFVGECPEGMEACHFPDRDPANCKLSNLRWDTKVENEADKLRIKLREEAALSPRDHRTIPQSSKNCGSQMSV